MKAKTENAEDDNLRKQSLDEAIKRSSPDREVVYKAVMIEGEAELARPSAALAWSGLAAGLSMGFSLIAEALLTYYLPESPSRPLIAKLGYSVGFVIVILGRQQFFTENTLTVILPLLDQKTWKVFRNVARLWGIVFASNFVGVVLIAWIVARTAALDPEVRAIFLLMGESEFGLGFGTTLLRGIFAGWLIALMVWLLPFAESARITVIVLLTYIIGLAHFPHVIAGSLKVLYLVMRGEMSAFTVFGAHILPSLIGNTLGGVALVAALAHAQVIGINQNQQVLGNGKKNRHQRAG